MPVRWLMLLDAGRAKVVDERLEAGHDAVLGLPSAGTVGLLLVLAMTLRTIDLVIQQ